MENRIDNYLNGIFGQFKETNRIIELKEDLLIDLQEHYKHLIENGKDEDTAFRMTIESIGDIEETIIEIGNSSKNIQQGANVNFSGRDINDADLKQVIAHKSNFTASDITNTDFENADLTGSKFYASNVINGNFTNTNLTECKFKASKLTGSIFNKTIMKNTIFSAQELGGATFINVTFDNVKFIACDFDNVIFDNCRFVGGEFSISDFRKTHFDNMYLENVIFKKCSLAGSTFNGSTIRNVNFVSGIMLTNKFYKDAAKINFNGAFMDKLTYQALQGIYLNLEGVTII